MSHLHIDDVESGFYTPEKAHCPTPLRNHCSANRRIVPYAETIFAQVRIVMRLYWTVE